MFFRISILFDDKLSPNRLGGGSEVALLDGAGLLKAPIPLNITLVGYQLGPSIVLSIETVSAHWATCEWQLAAWL